MYREWKCIRFKFYNFAMKKKYIYFAIIEIMVYIFAKGRLQKKKHYKLGLLAEPRLTPPPPYELGPRYKVRKKCIKN